jgi:protoporphyrinogen oxidase
VSRLDPSSDRIVIGAGSEKIQAGTVMSTLPIPVLAKMADAPTDVVAAGERLRHRAMVLAYLVLDTPRLTDYDAHYFPGEDTPVSRLSEPKNFRVSDDDPPNHTVVCAEMACWVGDATWEASADTLAAAVIDTLTPIGFSFPRLVFAEVRRIARCYPVYTGTYFSDLALVEKWAATVPRLLTFGRQGLFTPDNTHHNLEMGWDAAGVIRNDGTIDTPAWSRLRESFRSNVVED